MYYGGWVAPNIWYLGAAGVINFGGARIGGLSGIFNDRHYRMVGAAHATACSSPLGRTAGPFTCQCRAFHLWMTLFQAFTDSP
jgi:hypothetical protein